MRSPKSFLILLFLVGVLFIIGINLGALAPDNQNFQPPGWLSTIGKSLTSPQPLPIADLSATTSSCLHQKKLVIPKESSCTFAIQQSLFSQRIVTLRLVQGTSATVKLTQEDMLPIQQNLTGLNAVTHSDIPETLKIYSGKAHGTLVIICNNAGEATTCELTPQ